MLVFETKILLLLFRTAYLKPENQVPGVMLKVVIKKISEKHFDEEENIFCLPAP
jgi:hypothetical protein